VVAKKLNYDERFESRGDNKTVEDEAASRTPIMSKTAANVFFRHLRRIALLGAGPQISDGQLLEQFIARRDEAAFAMLVRRHGPLVFGVCRRMIGNIDDAEDAFQATFLVLARKATTIVPREAVANWLYGVAFRTAQRAKACAARRWAREKQVKNMPQPIVEPVDRIRDLEPVLDEELSKLAEKYRLPMVLCDLEGRPRKQVARQLNLPEGTLSARLARGRKMLAQRLHRRGVTLAGAGLATLFAGNSALANVPLPLVSSTINAAIAVAAGGAATGAVSAKVVALMEGVLRSMWLTKFKIAMFLLLLVGVLTVGFSMIEGPVPASGQTDDRKPAAAVVVDKEAKQAQAALRWKERLAVKNDGWGQSWNVAISPDGKRIAAAFGPDTKVLDATNGMEVVTLAGTEKAHPKAIAFSPDGKLIAQSADLGDVLLCSADFGEVKAKLECEKHVYALAFSPNGKTLATASGNAEGGELQLWDLTTNKVLRVFNKSDGPRENKEPGAWSISFSGDGKKLASAQGSARTAKVWDVETGKELATFGKHSAWVVAVAFSPDGKTVAAASAGKDPQVKLWDLATLKERFTLKGPICPYNSLAFAPDGKILAVAGQDDRDEKNAAAVVRLWDPASGKQIAVLDMQGDRTNWSPSLAFSRNGILVTANDAAVRIWETEK
jgi:RNA polymerase sigma factor (sigma-70 family)